MHVLKLKQRPKPREGVWTRIGILRSAFMSLRLYMLLRELKVIGLIPTGSEPRERPTSDDRDWIARKLEIFAAAGARPSKPTGKQRDWFEAYLTSHKGKGVSESQIAGAEKRLGLALPASYRQFMTRLGKRKFRNIEEEPGFDVTIVPPKELDFSGDWLRDSQQPPADDDTPAKTLPIGTTGFGDYFVFDVGHGLIDGEYPVFIYRHESDEYEPYADSFAMCIKRFVG
ncbi:MAG TPA: SMI1/KNR4 family protein [Humisphaera sp.]|jgi:hypothetical protein|nr:SMI1/KNR4 family protein [Humisphaera sp.]